MAKPEPEREVRSPERSNGKRGCVGRGVVGDGMLRKLSDVKRGCPAAVREVGRESEPSYELRVS